LVIPGWAVGPLGKWVAKHYAKGFAPAVLHSHLGRAHKLGNWLRGKLKIPHVVTMHLRYKAREHAAADARIAIAGWQLAEVPQALHATTRVVWNSAPLPENPAARPRHEGPFVFGSVGRLHPHKGMITLVKAFQHAFPGNLDVRLIIIGDGPEGATLHQMAQTDPRLQLRGNVPAAPHYAQFDAYVSAAQYEPFGLTILEAMSHHLPIVCTRTQGPTEFLAAQPHQPVWAEPKDVYSLAAALRVCHAEGRRQVAWDMAPFEPARAAAHIVVVYQELTL
jgi:glycosyltransferase involved in cell wall biosynthesis